MGKHDADARRERLFRIEELYRSGLTFEQIAEKLDPPVSTQRAWQLLREGAALGLYPLPKRRNRTKERLGEISEDDVRAAYSKCNTAKDAAQILGITPAALGERFGRLVRELHAERIRQTIIDDYFAIAKARGRLPSLSEAGPNLSRRVSNHFGSFRAFYEAANVDAHCLKKRKCASSTRR